jgi:hypothetical protein
VIKVSTNYLDYMALMDTFNKIVKEMKDSDESNKKFTALLSSLTLQENTGRQAKKEPMEVKFVYRRNGVGV